MKISEIKIKFIKPNNGIIAFASIVIDDGLCLSGIAIHQRLNSNGYRLTYPKKDNFNIFYPINQQISKTIESAIFTAPSFLTLQKGQK